VLVRELDAELEDAHGLALTSYEVLARLEDAPGHRMRMRDLADAVLLSRSGLTRLVDRLARDGLLQRRSCPNDARGAYAVLTPAGAQTLGAARPTHIAGVRRRFLRRFDATELERLSGTWERLDPELLGPDTLDPTTKC
jgi:DNA-binding MarR family transcriptional regulator